MSLRLSPQATFAVYASMRMYVFVYPVFASTLQSAQEQLNEFAFMCMCSLLWNIVCVSVYS